MQSTASTTFTLRLDPADKERLERLAESTGRSRSYLAAEAISTYLDLQGWQVEGIKTAIDTMDQGKAIPQWDVREWVSSWGREVEGAKPEPAV